MTDRFIVKEGLLTFANGDFSSGCWAVTSFTAEITAEVAQLFHMCDGGWAETVFSNKTATVSWETAYNATDGIDLDNTVGEEAYLLFETIDGKNYHGSVIITSASISAPRQDIAMVSWSATCNGIYRES